MAERTENIIMIVREKSVYRTQRGYGTERSKAMKKRVWIAAVLVMLAATIR